MADGVEASVEVLIAACLAGLAATVVGAAAAAADAAAPVAAGVAVAAGAGAAAAASVRRAKVKTRFSFDPRFVQHTVPMLIDELVRRAPGLADSPSGVPTQGVGFRCGCTLAPNPRAWRLLGRRPW